MKYYAFTTTPDGYLEGWSQSFILVPDKNHVSEHWVFIQEVEFNPNAVDIDTVRNAAVKNIDAEMEAQRINFTHGMEELKARKESLLAIEHKPEESK